MGPGVILECWVVFDLMVRNLKSFFFPSSKGGGEKSNARVEGDMK